jgi:F0F1-type ATP synthase assembly protein I
MSAEPTQDPTGPQEPEQSSMTHDLRRAAQGLGAGSESMDFISSVLAGLLIGFGLDWWLDTRPVFIVIGIVLGFVAGFFKLWVASAVLERQAEERRRD